MKRKDKKDDATYRPCQKCGIRTPLPENAAQYSFPQCEKCMELTRQTRHLNTHDNAAVWLAAILDTPVQPGRAAAEVYSGDLVYQAAAPGSKFAGDAVTPRQAELNPTDTKTYPRDEGGKRSWMHLDLQAIRKALTAAIELYKPGPHTGGQGCFSCGVSASSEWREASEVPGAVVCSDLCWPLLVDAVYLHGEFYKDQVVDRLRDRAGAAALLLPKNHRDRLKAARNYGFKLFGEAFPNHAGFSESWEYLPADLLTKARFECSDEGRRQRHRVRRNRERIERAVASVKVTPPPPAMTRPGKSDTAADDEKVDATSVGTG